MLTKCCSKCKQSFPATQDYFYPEMRNRDGLRSECKACHRTRIYVHRAKYGRHPVKKVIPVKLNPRLQAAREALTWWLNP